MEIKDILSLINKAQAELHSLAQEEQADHNARLFEKNKQIPYSFYHQCDLLSIVKIGEILLYKIHSIEQVMRFMMLMPKKSFLEHHFYECFINYDIIEGDLYSIDGIEVTNNSIYIKPGETFSATTENGCILMVEVWQN